MKIMKATHNHATGRFHDDASGRFVSNVAATADAMAYVAGLFVAHEGHVPVRAADALTLRGHRVAKRKTKAAARAAKNARLFGLSERK